MYRPLPLALLWALCSPATALAQDLGTGDRGPRSMLPRDREIALARSAAPAAVSGEAAVYVLTTTGYELAVEGRNGAACYVSRDWTISIEPHCFDAEGAATIMRMNMRRVELMHAGMAPEEAGRVIADGLLAGEFRLPSRPAMSWMMSSAQQLVSPDGRLVGAWKPHIMIYFPFLTAQDVALAGAGAASLGTMIVNGGAPDANLMVIVPEFADPPPAPDPESP